ncbi:MAG TPA: hypothetical protein VKU19_30255 [Bryobacteraceae bacterium]|nr:hypothetical protein [Bryobacteraceae bacterium]
MKKQLAFYLLATAAAWAAPPAIRSGGVVNAATNAPLGTAGSGIAQGSYFAIYGSGLGPDTFASASIPYPTTLGGASVTVTPASGAAVQAFLTYAQAGQINAILPSTTPLGGATVTVTYNNATSTPAKITVVQSSFGTFSTGYPIGAAAIINVNTAPLYNLLTNAANTGDVLELFGTGLGPITGGDNTAPGVVSPSGIDVKILVGGTVVTPLYAGRSPQYPALDQINFVLPSDPGIPDGCFVPIAVQVNGVVGNYATFSKATGSRTCPAPLGLTPTALAKLDQGGKLNVGALTLARSTILASIVGGLSIPINAATEQAGGVFASFGTSDLFGLLQTPGAIPPLNAAGTCLVQTEPSTAAPTSTIPPIVKFLDAGSKLTLSGPNNKAQDLPSQANVGYAAFLAQSGATLFGLQIPGVPTVPAGVPATYIEPGGWTIKGSGGADVGAFTASITVPAALNCSPSCDITAIDRTQPLVIQWTGGGGSQDYVEVAGVATTASLADPTKNVAVLFECTAKASDGTLTVPVSVLSQMPTSSADALAPNTGALLVINGLGNSDASFTAPLTAGGVLDAGYFGYTSVRTKLMQYK